jgi:alpha 1,3-glucosidase
MDEGYSVYTVFRDADLFVKKADGVANYEGHCWPGNSAWPDFLNPRAREVWASRYALDTFPGATERGLHIWNDMNEPSVFSGYFIVFKEKSQNIFIKIQQKLFQ